MFNKNLKYYRLRKNMSKRELASKIDVTPMAITNYENGTRKPGMEILKLMASALEVKVSDFLAVRNESLSFSHGEFRKYTALLKNQQEYVRESVEDYFGRFFDAVELLGGDVLINAPKCNEIPLSDSAEDDACKMREYLRVGSEGPVGDLVEVLENQGVLMYPCAIDSDHFSGMNGCVDGRPYITFNNNMTPERIRSTIAHELAHALFVWPKDMGDKEVEKRATAISGAFLFPKKDVIRELGVHRSAITGDMALVCKEYGISMYLLTMRAQIVGVVSTFAAKDFYIEAAKLGWRKHEPSRIKPEEPLLFKQLVYRAVNEKEISLQRGAELLQISYKEVENECCSFGV